MTEIAVALLKTKDRKYVFQRRTKDAPTSPGKLGFFGGHMEPGEDKLTAAVRELNEETSLNLTKKDLKFVVTEADDQLAVHLFEVEVGNTDFEVFEGDGKEMYSIKDVMKRKDLSKATSSVLKKIIEEGII